jgi:hypothetical protein
MLYIFKLLFLLININQETVLNWLGIADPNMQNLSALEYGYGSDIAAATSTSDISLETFRIIVDALWLKLQTGLVLTDIETILFFIAFIRFIILAIRYNLKTSFYITCIGIVAAYLWYRHFIEMISVYQTILFRIPVTQKLAMDIMQIQAIKAANNSVPLRWSNPFGIIWTALVRGSQSQSTNSMIDPVSMLFANIPERFRETTDPFYYAIYRDYGPQAIKLVRDLARDISSLAAYTFVTRIGKRYCPYFVRWHWTFILIFGFLERVFMNIGFRANYYVTLVLIPQLKEGINVPTYLNTEIEFLNIFVASLALTHLVIILFALLHALCGQYFYFPFLTENAELHIGKRPKTVYSGGYTSWQDRDPADIKRGLIPWYGWFGRGTDGQNRWQIGNILKKFTRKVFRKLFKN